MDITIPCGGNPAKKRSLAVLENELLSKVLFSGLLDSIDVITICNVSKRIKLVSRKSLRRLDLHQMNLSDVDIPILVENYPSLQQLDLAWCNKLTSTGLCSLAPSQPAMGRLSQLQDISFHGIERVDDAAVEQLSQWLSELRTIDLTKTRVTDRGCYSLCKFKKLGCCKLVLCKDITDEGVKILSGIQSLRELTLGCCWYCRDTHFQLFKLTQSLSTQENH